MSRADSLESQNEILVVDDQANWLRLFNRLNEKKRSRFSYRTFEKPREALDYIGRDDTRANVYAAFIDFELGSEVNGLQFIKDAQEAGLDVPFVLCTQYEAKDLPENGIGLNEIIQGDVSYYISKGDLSFQDDDVDKVVEAARQNYSDALGRMFRSYAESNFKLLAKWRGILSTSVAKCDQLIIDGRAASSRPADGGEPVVGVSLVQLSEMRGHLNDLVGLMQTDHIDIARQAIGKPWIADRPQATVSPRSPDYEAIRTVADQLRKGLTASAHRSDTSASEGPLAEISPGLEGMSPHDQAVALSSTIDTMHLEGHDAPALDLTVRAIDHFTASRDIVHEIAFTTIAARLNDLQGDQAAHAIFSRRARELARRSGRLSLQLDLLENEQT